MPRETSREIDAAAASWAARLEGDDISAQDEACLDEWLSGDERRIGALAKARAVAALSYRTRAGDLETMSSARFRPANPSRRVLIAASVAGLAMVGTGYVGLRALNADRQLRTTLGETRVVSLVDGSVMFLNTLTHVSVNVTDEVREIRVLAGEVMFDIMNDTRPFRIEAGQATVLANAGGILVRAMTDRPMRVLVTRGAARLLHDGRETPIPEGSLVELARGTVQPRIEALSKDGIAAATAWREGRVMFEDATLAEAASEFRRYSDIEIVVPPGVADLRINGLFVANDPVSFAQAVAATLEIGVSIEERRIVFRG